MFAPMDSTEIFWVATICVLLAVELATLGLTTIWFVGGALIALAADFVYMRFAAASFSAATAGKKGIQSHADQDQY